MNYTTHIQPLEDAGKTDAEIAAIVSQTTVRPIKRRDARTYLFNNGIEFQDENGVFMGRLKATLDSPLSAILGENEGAFKLGLKRFLGYLRSVDWENLETNTSKEGPSSLLLLQLLGAINAWTTGIPDVNVLGVTQQEADGFLALGGGLNSIDAAGVAALRQAHLDQTAREAAKLAIESKASQALAAAANALAAGKTPEEITAAANQAWGA